MENDKVLVRAIVRGTVQGVGFRFRTESYAAHYAVKGTVKNLADGSVEIYAEGTQENIDRLLKSLQEHFGRYVARIEVEPMDLLKNFSDFRIVF
jgi:acylphosphatase